jgi:TetR/AcrR family transcriptional repressor of nem operon
VDRVIAASGTSKGAFFHHFDSKAALALARALVDRYAAAVIAHLDRAVAEVTAQTADPAARVSAFLRIFEDGADELMAVQSSCLYVSVLTERQLAQGGTRDQIAHAVLAWRTELSRLLDDALQYPAGHGHLATAAVNREPRDDGQETRAAGQETQAAGPPAEAVDALADHVFVTFEGAFILARSLSDPGHMRAQLRVLRQLLEALLRHPSAPVAYIAALSHQNTSNAQ